MGRAVDYRCFVVLVLLAGGVGCAAAKKAKVPMVTSPKAAKFSIQVNVSDTANQNSPLPVDFVLVKDKKLLPEVAKMAAKDWFERRVQIQRDFPNKVQVVSWEWVPGQHVGAISIAVDPETKGAFLFANYLNGGEHRGYVDVHAPVAATFGPEEFSVQQLK